MPDLLTALLAFAVAGGLTLLLVPVARKVAVRSAFLDHPIDYKAHRDSTPYLGGAALLAAFSLAAVAFARGMPELGGILVVALLLCLMGSIDDRRTLPPGLRFVLQLGAGLFLWSQDIRWEVTGVEAVDLAISLVWVAGLANAFNLLDNIDGATGTTAAVSAAGIGVIALVQGQGELAACALALSGACAAFLVFNLAGPATIFLGDGGSLPIGFLIAALAMLLPGALGNEAILAAVPIAGIAIFDTSLVVLSRTRRGVSIVTGGRDHTTHRLLAHLGTPRRVALVLAVAQAALCALAAVMLELSPETAVSVAIGYVLVGSALLIAFESPTLAGRPVRESG